MSFAKLNIAGKGKNFLPAKKHSELEENKVIQVTYIKTVNARFGLRVVAEIEEQFQVFWPKRIADVISEDETLLPHLKELSSKKIWT